MMHVNEQACGQAWPNDFGWRCPNQADTRRRAFAAGVGAGSSMSQ